VDQNLNAEKCVIKFENVDINAIWHAMTDLVINVLKLFLKHAYVKEIHFKHVALIKT